MIIPMKKIEILLYHREKEKFLRSLRELGVVHVSENPEASSETLQENDKNIKKAERVFYALGFLAKEEKTTPAEEKNTDVLKVISQHESLRDRMEEIDQETAAQKKNISQLEPWGDFSLNMVSKLSNSGISIRFYSMPRKKFNQLEKDKSRIEIIKDSGSNVFFIVLLREKEQFDPGVEEIRLPDISLSKARSRLSELEKEQSGLKKQLVSLCSSMEALEEYIEKEKKRRDFESARLSMAEAAGGSVMNLTGWVPRQKEKKVKEFLDKFNAWYSFEEPLVEDDVPVKMKNGRFSKLLEPVTKIFDLPDYFELDPTPFFAPLFVFFFGLCLGDVGYGLIILLFSGIAYKKIPEKLKGISVLGMILGFMTILAGVLTNTVFGFDLFAAGDGQGVLQEGSAAAMLRPVETESGTYFPAMPFSLYLGIIQIIMGMAMKAYNQAKTFGRIYAVQHFGSISMVIGITIIMAKINFIDLGILSLGLLNIGDFVSAPSYTFAGGLCAAGALIVLLFNNPEKGIGVRFGLGLWELYQFATALMADSLSYLRLFALGVASALLGMAFNQIAFMLILKDGSPDFLSPMVIFTVLILIVGHGLNLALNALGSFVHPLRLTFVEFYKNLGFKGGGKTYKPFSNV